MRLEIISTFPWGILVLCIFTGVELKPLMVDDIYMKVDDMLVLDPKLKAKSSDNAKHLWPDGRIPYTIKDGLSKDHMKMLQYAMDVLEEYTCVKFIRRTAERNYLHINYTDKGCYAHVGFMSKGLQKLNLGKGCWEFGTVVHELIHTIGFSHTHQRNDRDNFVTVLFENVKKGKEHNFMLDDAMGMSFDDLNLPYNYASVMHYSRKAFSSNGQTTILPKVWKIEDEAIHADVDNHGRPIIGLHKLTWGDVNMINRMYKEECGDDSAYESSEDYSDEYM